MVLRGQLSIKPLYTVSITVAAIAILFYLANSKLILKLFESCKYSNIWVTIIVDFFFFWEREKGCEKNRSWGNRLDVSSMQCGRLQGNAAGLERWEYFSIPVVHSPNHAFSHRYVSTRMNATL